jgi:hypothetical protein
MKMNKKNQSKLPEGRPIQCSLSLLIANIHGEQINEIHVEEYFNDTA